MINFYVCKTLTPVNIEDNGIVENSCVYNPHLGAGLHDQPERGVVHVGAVGQVQVLQGNMLFIILPRETHKQQRNMKEGFSPGSPSDELTRQQLVQLLIPSDKPGKGNSSNGRKYISSCCLINRQFKCFEFDYNAHLDIQVVEMVTSGGEVKEAAIGDQGACLDLQLLGCQV